MWSCNYRLYHNVYLTNDRIKMCEELLSSTVAYLIESISAYVCACLSCPLFCLFVPSPNSPNLSVVGFLGFLFVWVFLSLHSFKPSCPAAKGNLLKACFA